MTTPTRTLRLPLTVFLLAGWSFGLNLACGGGKNERPPVDQVYVAGYASTGIQLENSIPNQAMLWVDGKATQLSPGSASFANALAVLGTDTYVVGKDTEADGRTRTVVWTNGTAAPLTAGPAGVAYPTSIAVSNRTVLVGGDVTQDGVNIPGCIWINGALQTLAGRRVEGVALQDERVVAAGWASEIVEVAPNYMWIRPSPMAWRDGAASRLTTGVTGGEALGVQVSGANVFVAGMEWRWNPQASKTSPSLPSIREIGSVENAEMKASALRLQSAAYDGSMSPSVAAYWKNGNAVYLSDGSRWAQGAAICVSGNDVYVAGLRQINDSYDAAVYWKNGVMVRLTQGNSEARTTGIVVLGSDIYVSGYEVVQGVCVATYWKNGTPIRLTDGKLDSFARGIVVQRIP
ncbi:MAG: hypothetical protein IPP78_03340 [Holophagaceae bacterium]|nr:hypothetical protein [Holophagaceae bacterium]